MAGADRAQEARPPWCDSKKASDAGAAEATAADASSTEAKADGTTFHVPSSMRFLRVLGKGTYGTVSAFQDAVSGEEVAIKKIPNPFKNPVDGKRCLREIKLLKCLEHDAIVAFRDILPPPSPDYNEVYLVTELADADLHTVISSDQALSEDHIQFFIYNILRALRYMHSANVVHRDLKPLNVLVNKNCDIKLCDFGLARGRAGFSQEDDDFLRTEYVGTRWYRAPEVVLTSMEYTAAVDIWSAGCILGELMGRTPMFRGTDFLDQIRSIIEVMGSPTEEELSFIPPENEAARKFIKTRFPDVARKDWQVLYPNASASQCDLLDRMLRFDPKGRVAALEALQHEYLEDSWCEEDDVVATHHVDWAFDDDPFEPGRLQCLIYGEVAALHPEIMERDREALERKGWLASLEALLPTLGTPTAEA